MLLFHYIKRVYKNDSLKKIFNTFLIIIILFLSYSVIYSILEHSSIKVGFWQAWQTITTVGYGDAPPSSSLGRLGAVIFGTLGIAFLGVLFSGVFDYKSLIYEQRRFGKLDARYENGYLIINYPGEYKILTLIEELREKEDNVPITILCEELEKLPITLESLPKVEFVSESLSRREAYQRAKLENSKCVIVFPKIPSDPRSDAQTIVVVNAVKKIRKDIKIIYFIVDTKNSWLFENHENVYEIRENFEVLTCVQECQDENSSLIAELLLTNSSEGNIQSFYVGDIGDITWGEFVKKSVDYNFFTKGKDSFNPIGIKSGDKLESIPIFDKVIKNTDQIFINARNNFDWNKLINYIKNGG